ncbi:hypothetical protein IFM89_019949 [Coptis chinensis]|uniref:KIB1-4 beta-propeller domain-containing protein n=1 Tax=Coptis chinensis TaxID=261450 RepID=A0A835LS73_9MAGN|nr:hypothetical protein IFM89_019949 [Coptis chinensis]
MMSISPITSASSQTTILIIYGTPPSLAFSKLGYKSWTPVESARPITTEGLIFLGYLDAIYCKERFYVTYNHGRIDFCDIVDTSHPNITEYALPPPEQDIYSSTGDLVVTDDGLYLVVRKNQLAFQDFDKEYDINEAGENNDIDNVEVEDYQEFDNGDY